MATQMKLIFTGIILAIFFLLGCSEQEAHKTPSKPDPSPPPKEILCGNCGNLAPFIQGRVPKHQLKTARVLHPKGRAMEVWCEGWSE